MKSYRLQGEILAPVHIGTGQTWEPLEYHIDSQTKLLHRFSTEEILIDLEPSELEQFYQFNDSGDLNAVKLFITQKARERSKGSNHGAIVVTSAVAKLYDEKIDDISNQLLIGPMIRSKSKQQVFIPGSSLKGAIRTAIISELAKNSKLPKPNPFGREVWRFEADVLRYRDAKQDPFRAVKIADADLTPDATFICQVFNIRKNREGNLDQTSIQLIHEVTHSNLSSKIYGEKVTFETELRLDIPLMNQRAVSQKFSIEQIKNSCNRFYRDKMNMEHEKFYVSSPLAEFSEELLKEPVGENECIIRVGRFSGVESVTLDEYRDPQPPGRNRGWGRSRNIADGKFPMGWVKISIL
ncbi:MAG: type III-A CRISPR-associated RAMP protein Csm5 [bacterium]